MSERTFTGLFEQDDDWWVAWCEEVPGAVTQGQTLEEARENLREAIQLVLETRRELAAEELAREGRAALREDMQVTV